MFYYISYCITHIIIKIKMYSFYNPEMVDFTESQFMNKIVPILPIPDRFYSKLINEALHKNHNENSKLIDEEERMSIRNFFYNFSNMTHPNISIPTLGYPIIANSAILPNSKLDDASPVALFFNNVGGSQEHSTEVQSPDSFVKDFDTYTKKNVKSFSDATSADSSINNKSSPSKEELYNLSAMIQNTSPDFQSILSSDLRSYLDSCYLTEDGLYVSK